MYDGRIDAAGMAISMLAVDPARPTTIQAAATRPINVQQIDYGIVKSTNGGLTWTTTD
jgi:hypothetical protein